MVIGWTVFVQGKQKFLEVLAFGNLNLSACPGVEVYKGA